MKPGLGSPLGAGASPCATALFLPASLSLTQGDPVSGLSLVLGFSISKPYSTLFFSQYGHAALPYWYLDGCCAASSVCKHPVRCTLFIQTEVAASFSIFFA
jgi:hypothetical protein